MESKFIKHVACEACGSHDANSVYSDGHTHCFACERTVNGNGEYIEVQEEPKEVGNYRPLPVQFRPFTSRGLSQATIQKYGVTVGDPENARLEAVYPFFDRDGTHVSNKVRFQEKEFAVEGDWKARTLFGQQVFPAGSAKQITLTEGQDDAMSAYEMQGSRFPCVSVDNSTAAVKNVRDNFEYLNSFDSIVVNFDNDAPGKTAAAQVAAMFAIGKVRVLTLQEGKDANDYIKANKAKEYIKEWWAAPAYTPSGLKYAKDLWETVRVPRKFETVPYPYEGLNHATYGIRLSEFVLLTAQTKVGKTALLKEIMSGIRDHAKPEYGIGGLFLEESNEDTCLGLMSIAANKPLHLPDVREGVTEDELRGYFDAACNTDRIVLWDHFGSNSIDEVLNKIRHMHNLGCKYIILDHLSIVVSDQSGDERKQLDEISTKLKMLCMELNVAVIAVIHQNRNNQIRSSAGPEQIANITIKLHREMEDPDEWRRNVTKVSIQYNRFCGRTGPCCYLFYQQETNRLVELDAAEVARYESKKPATAIAGAEKWETPS